MTEGERTLGSSPTPANVSSDLDRLRRALGPTARFGEALARHTSVRVGGPADLFFAARTAEQLSAAVDRAAEAGIPWRVIGGASNLLISDEGIEGLVVKAASTGVEQIEANGDVLVCAQAGAMLAALGKQMALRGLRGLEWAVNVPGSVGASVVNNSGAFGSCIAEHLVSARIHIPGEGTVSFPISDLGHAYRTSRLKRGEINGVVLDATYRLTVEEEPEVLKERISEIQRIRRQTQPTGYSVGSVFTNPDGDSAGKLVESVGLKGFRIGDAEVSILHANFIVNRGAARAADVLALMRHVQDTVWQRAGVWLTAEVQLAGRFSVDDMLAPTPPGAAA